MVVKTLYPGKRKVQACWRYTSEVPGRKDLTQNNAGTVRVSLPCQVVERLGRSQRDVERAVLELALVELFRRGDVSAGWAAERLGISKWEFIQILDRHEVAYLDMTPEELEQELEVARQYLGVDSGPKQPPSSTQAG